MSVNFMGRLLQSLFVLTDPASTNYSTQALGWFDSDGKEVCGISTFALLHKSVGLLGLVGLDRMLSFRIVHTLNNLVKFWGNAIAPTFLPLLEELENDTLWPTWRLPDQSTRVYNGALKKVAKVMPKLLKAVLIIGQAALVHRQISSELSFSSRLEANLLSVTLDTMNKALLRDIRSHYRDPKHNPYPGDNDNPVLLQLNRYLENVGGNDPFQQIYITMEEPLQGLPVLLMLFVVAYMPKLEYDSNFGSLVAQRGKNLPIDGAHSLQAF